MYCYVSYPFTGTGAIAFVYKADDVTIELVGWKGNKSVRAYVARNDRIHYLRLLGADTSKYEKNKFAEQRDLEAKNAHVKDLSAADSKSNENSEVNGTSREDTGSSEMIVDANGSGSVEYQ